VTELLKICKLSIFYLIFAKSGGLPMPLPSSTAITYIAEKKKKFLKKKNNQKILRI